MFNKSEDIKRITNAKQLNDLIDVIEQSIKNEKFWLPITQTSRNHFFDEKWTKFYGSYQEGKLIAAAGMFFNKNEYGESAKAIGLKGNIVEVGRVMCLPQYRNNGITTRVVEKAINSTQADNFIATVHPQNEPSYKLLKRLGFEKRGYIVKNGYERYILVRKGN